MSRVEEDLSQAIDVISGHFKKQHLESDHCGNGDLSMRECQLLHILRKEKKTMSELSQYLSLSPATLTAHIDSLVKKELVIRESDEEDRRKTYITLSPRGEEISKEMGKKQDQLAKIMLTPLNKEEQKILTVLLTKVKEHIQKEQ